MIFPERVGDQRRIGVAIEVPPPFGVELQRARKEFGDPLADLIPPHITLLGPTIIEPQELDEVFAHLSAIAARYSPFEVRLRSSGTFRPLSPVVFVQVAQGIAECESLERAVRSGPLSQSLRFNYHPHVTVAHEVSDDQLDFAFEAMASYEASFVTDAISLYEHGDDNVWRQVHAFPLSLARAEDAGQGAAS